MSNSGWAKKVQEIPREAIAALTLIFILIPMLYPLNIPAPISADVSSFHNYILDLPEDSVVLIPFEINPFYWARGGAACSAIFNFLLTQPLKIIFVSTIQTGPVYWQPLLDRMVLPEGKEYGKDFVYLGFVTGEEAAVVEFASDLRTTKTDYYGTLLEDYPIMEGIEDANDVSLLIQYMGLPEMIKWYIRQWNIPYGTPICAVQTPVNSLMNLPFKASGNIQWVIWGNKGGAEFENLLGKPGWGTANLDAHNLSHILVISLVLLSNIGYAVEKRSKGGQQ